MTSRIELNGMKFFAHHGLYDEEKRKGGWFSVDVSFDCESTQAMNEDAIEGTVNYELVYNIVKEEMQIRSKLIEHLAGRIFQHLSKQIPEIQNLQITVKKLDAPLGGPLHHVSVTLK